MTFEEKRLLKDIVTALESLHRDFQKCNETAAANQKSATSAHKPSEAPPVVSIARAILELPPAVTDYYESKRHKEPRHYLTVKNVAEGLGIFIAFGLLVLNILTLRNLITQTDGSERAWVNVTFSGPQNSVATTPFLFPIAVSNDGKTPALHIYGEASIKLKRRGENFQFVYRPKHWFPSGALFEGSPPINIIPVTVPYLVYVDGKPVPSGFDKTTAEEIVRGDVFVIIFVKIDYDDVFGYHHWVHRCYEIQTMTMRTDDDDSCPNYNSVDRQVR